MFIKRVPVVEYQIYMQQHEFDAILEELLSIEKGNIVHPQSPPLAWLRKAMICAVKNNG